MEMWRLLNRLVRCTELMIVTFVVLLYLLGMYEATAVSGISVRLYLLVTSFYYYVGCLAKSPRQLIDFGSANVKGICKRCNMMVGERTVHCEVCNKCYHRRDHHCPIIGRCVASNNLKDLYFAVLFANLHSVAAMAGSSTRFSAMLFVHRYLFVMSGVFVCWLTLLVLAGKTTRELVRSKGNVADDIRVSRLREIFCDGVVGTLAPYARWRTSVVG